MPLFLKIVRVLRQLADETLSYSRHGTLGDLCDIWQCPACR